ncbi:MAG TPA: hypothetical protein PLM07_00225 [Candidatus Rifleibacterium sp.]|nr:hypothetical protein [Candidatus Rifleibacterium sp.]HPT44304.1 hypothetical protein [Candidatus Rifleibacterium sp.]
MPSRNQVGSTIKRALLAAAISAFLCVPIVSEARLLAGSVTERKQNRKINTMLKSARKNVDSGKIQTALEAYWKILELDPNETFAYLELGEVYVNLSIFDRAIELLEPGLTMAEREMDADTVCYYYCILTNAHIGLNQIGLANKSLLKAAEASPANPMPRKVMGDIYLANDRIADAMKAYRKAVELDPAYQPAAEKLGELVAKYGDQPPAKTRDKKVIQAKAEKLPTAKVSAGATVATRPTVTPASSALKKVPAADPTPETPTRPATKEPVSKPPVVASVASTVSPLLPASATINAPAGETAPPRPMPEVSPVKPPATQTAVADPGSRPMPVAVANPTVGSTAAALAGSVSQASNASASASITADAAEVENQLDKLLAGTPEEKSAATSFFVRLEEKGLTEIEELLYDPDPEVRVLAVRTLIEFKAFGQRVKTMLQDASEDPDPLVIEEINSALQKL